jgi:iron complex transport system substrate-binding protein
VKPGRRALLCSLALFALLAAACGKANDPVPERPTPTPEISAPTRATSRTVTDGLGRSVSLGETVRRVVALSPSAAEFALALGLEVAGRSTDTAATVAPNAKPVGSAISPDFAAVAALEPDVVIADATYHSGRTRDFDRFAYPVYVLRAGTYGEVLATLQALGEALGRTDEAQVAAAVLQQKADAARAQAAAGMRAGAVPRVLILTGGGRDVFAGGETTYLGSLLAELGAVNVAGTASEGGPVPGFGVIDVTQAASLLPDVVLVLSSGEGGLVQRIRESPAWANTSAVKQQRVLDLDTTLYLRAPGPRAGEALDALAKVLWP